MTRQRNKKSVGLTIVMALLIAIEKQVKPAMPRGGQLPLEKSLYRQIPIRIMIIK